MRTYQILVKSLQCGPCLNKIKASLLKIKGVTTLDIIKEENKIRINGDAIEIEEIIDNLAGLGYRQQGNDGFFSKANTFDYWFCYYCSSCDS